MDRSKFKEVLGSLDSDQRTAFLYLERIIKENKASSVSNNDYNRSMIQSKKVFGEVNDLYEIMSKQFELMQRYDISKVREEIYEYLDRTLTQTAKNMNESTKNMNVNSKNAKKTQKQHLDALSKYQKELYDFSFSLCKALEKNGISLGIIQLPRPIIIEKIKYKK